MNLVALRPSAPSTARECVRPTGKPVAAPRTIAALIPALLAVALASCLSEEALTAPPVDDPTAAPAFATADHLAALAAALEDARTRLLPAHAALSERLDPAVRGVEAALAAQDAAAFQRRLPEAEAALVALAALEHGNAAFLVELAAVGLAIEAAGAAVRASAPAGDTPTH